jgi:hypothetical protein
MLATQVPIGVARRNCHTLADVAEASRDASRRVGRIALAGVAHGVVEVRRADTVIARATVTELVDVLEGVGR